LAGFDRDVDAQTDVGDTAGDAVGEVDVAAHGHKAGHLLGDLQLLGREDATVAAVRVRHQGAQVPAPHPVVELPVRQAEGLEIGQ